MEEADEIGTETVKKMIRFERLMNKPGLLRCLTGLNLVGFRALLKDFRAAYAADDVTGRDQQANFYAGYLPRGTYVFSYERRASVSGQFQVMPARGFPFYFPGMFGNLFAVEEK
jgi:hypothetical protein